MIRKRLIATSLALALAGHAVAAEQELQLPELGDSTSSLISGEQEHELGRAWLKAFRSQVRTIDDPLLQSYLEDLIYRLASHSKLKDRRLEVVVVDNPTMNAFAVPGGVVGVHNGLFLFADTEAQMASVLGHELAHLSQRHFARSVEQQQRSSLPTLAGILGSLVLAATAGGDAGMAAMTATQAAALQNRLNYSRQNEQEADRIGMETIVEAGYDPNAVAAMFDNMMAATRYAGRRPPEFLMTHPLTESRISDARNRARDYPRSMYVDNIDYQLMRVRAELQLSANAAEAIKRFRASLDKSGAAQGNDAVADHYGLALAYLKNSEPAKAHAELAPLIARDPDRLAYIIAAADIDITNGKVDAALARLEKALRISPDNHPLTMSYANALLQSKQPQRAEAVLAAHVKRRPNDPAIWYQLAEVHGLAGNIVGVHQARAEYFVLVGALDQATRQLGYALPLVRDNRLATARIEERIREIEKMKDAMGKL